jgi:hypothetical protein
MARYQHLPVYKDCYDLTVQVLGAIRRFPRVFKYTLGEQIQNNLYSLLSMVVKINSAVHKKELLATAVLETELILTQIRLAKDMRCFANLKVYLDLSNRLVIISKQLEGWRKSSD